MGRRRIYIRVQGWSNAKSIAFSLRGCAGSCSRGENYSRVVRAFGGNCPGKLSFAATGSGDETDASDSGGHGVGVWRYDAEESVERIGELSAAHPLCRHGHDPVGAIAAPGQSVWF